MEIGLVRKVDIDEEMQQSYLDYAMSVIVARALPDARDGLKPVQRRILYAMLDMGLRADSDFKKSARIVGEVLGKYHPHGDMAVYEAMARMGQDFSMRYPLVDGQGNFGSVDGDPPAAMRYTEARLKPLSMKLLEFIDKNTVDFSPNFDGTLKEPVVLPASFPGLLVNGATGIAVGMATNIPPHNLGEVVEAMVFMLQKWEKLDDIAITDLMKFVKGPDFPTGGILLQEGQDKNLQVIYATGRGRVMVRGKVHVEEMTRGKNRLIITELPYQTNKSALIERIAELVRDGHLEGITDLRDESDRQGMRIVIETNKTAESEKLLRELYQRTSLQTNLGINMLALVNGEPRLMSLKQILRVYLEHRQSVVIRRSEFDLQRAKQRAHILEGLRIAINNLDEIIALIRKAADADQARKQLMRRFQLSETQAHAILDMPLKRLSALERKKIEIEYREVKVLIKNLEGLLHSPRRIRQVIETELVEIKETYSDPRRTSIISLKDGESASMLLVATDLIQAEPVWIGITVDGLVSRTRLDALPRISGRASPRWLLRVDTHQTLCLVAENGKTAAVAVHAIPEADSFQEGIPFSKVSCLPQDEKLVDIIALPPKQELPKGTSVVCITRNGMVKKTAAEEVPGPSAQPFVICKINPEDELFKVLIVKGDGEILMVSEGGMAIRFSLKTVRSMGLEAAGVGGIKLDAGDRVVAATLLQKKGEITLLAVNGISWRMNEKDFPLQGRFGQGVITCRPGKGNWLVGIITGKKNQEAIVHFRKAASKVIRLDMIPATGRNRPGRDALIVKTGDSILAVTNLMDLLAKWTESNTEGRKIDVVKKGKNQSGKTEKLAK